MDADFLASKGGQQHEKQPLLGPASIINNDSYNNINFYFHFNLTWFSVVKKELFFDYNDANFNTGLSLLNYYAIFQNSVITE